MQSANVPQYNAWHHKQCPILFEWLWVPRHYTICSCSTSESSAAGWPEGPPSRETCKTENIERIRAQDIV